MRFIPLVFTAMLALSSCSNTESASTTTTAEATPPQPKAPPQSNLGDEGTKAVMGTVASYYELKDALVATSAPKATEAATNLSRVAAEMQKTVLAGDSAHTRDALKPYIDTIITYSQKIAATNDPKCEQQRVAFEPVSRSMYELLKKADVKNAGIYHQYCPMAFNDKGAYWLSSVADIKNPYFGKKMLECGEVTDSL